MMFENAQHVVKSGIPFLPLYSGLGGYGASHAVTANNDAYLLPFWVPAIFSTNKVHFFVQTQNGNMDVGIYDKDGNRVVSSGSFSVPAAGVASQAITATTLYPSKGPYYFAMAFSSSTAVMRALNNDINLLVRAFRFATSFPLPATVNLGSPTARTLIMPDHLLENAGGPTA